MEGFIDEIDSNGNFVAKRQIGDLKKRMFMHRVALVIPKAEGGKILLSKRSATKTPFPGTFCCAVGGKVNHGETELQAAEREMEEEVGKSYPLRAVGSFLYDRPDYKAIFTVFTTTVSVSPIRLRIGRQRDRVLQAILKGGGKQDDERSPDAFAPTFIAAINESMDLLSGAEPPGQDVYFLASPPRRARSSSLAEAG